MKIQIKQLLIITLFIAVGNIALYLFIFPKINSKKENNKENGYAYISGKVTDFNNNPIEKATVGIKNANFKDIYQTQTDKNGNYKIKVKSGNYFALYAINKSDYSKTKLEYWAWNIPAQEDITINPEYDNLEIYGIHIFEPITKPNDTYRIYFRPMSLKKFKQINESDTIDIIPILQKEEITIKINDKLAIIKTLDKVLEYNSTGKYIYSYELQVIKPQDDINRAIDKISIKIYSNETNEIGKSDYFFRKKDLNN